MMFGSNSSYQFIIKEVAEQLRMTKGNEHKPRQSNGQRQATSREPMEWVQRRHFCGLRIANKALR
jgi:hypothetical protein